MDNVEQQEIRSLLRRQSSSAQLALQAAQA